MIRFFVLFFCLFLFYQTFAQKPEEDWDYRQVLEESESEKKTLQIKHADQIIYSQEIDAAGYNRARLYGRVFIIYENRKIFADEILIKFFNDKPEEIIASGNIFIETGKSIIIGEKMFFYPSQKTGIIYAAETFNKPYFIMGEYFKFIDEDKLIIEDTEFTNCDIRPAHYSLGANKSWIYQNDKDVFLGFHIKVGLDPIFYFPFMYRSYYGTGLITSLGKEEGVGWFLNNTYKTRGQGFEFKLMLDHYQKIGEYLGIEYQRSTYGNLSVKSALVYDRHVKYENGRFVNFFEQVAGEKPSSGRSLRYKIDLSYEKSLLSGEFLGISSSLRMRWFEPTDPFLTSQFESRRLEIFDIKKILFPESSPSSLAGSFSSGSGQGRIIDFNLNNSFYGFSLGITGNFNYMMSKTDDVEKAKNPYSPDYYKNYRSNQTFPNITLSRNFTLFDPILVLAQTNQFGETRITFPWSLNFSGNYVVSKSYSIGKISSENSNQRAQFSFSAPFNVDYKPYFVSLGLSLSHTSTFTQTKGYSDAVLTSHIYSDDYLFSFSSPLQFKIDGTNQILQFQFPYSMSYQKHSQETRYSKTDASFSDKSNTYLSRSMSYGTDVRYDFLKEYTYLESYIQAKMTYSESKRYGDVLPENQKITSRNYAYSAIFSSLRSSISLSTTTNLSSNISEENKKGPLLIDMETRLIPYVSIRDSYSYDRYYKKGKTNNLFIGSTISSKVMITEDFWINSLSFSANWFRNYLDYKNNYLSYNFALNFNATELWEISLVFSGSNNKLYFYTNKAPDNKRRDFWEDLWKSLKIWSIEERQYTYFKMSSFGLNIKHNLHEWMMEITSTFTPKLERNGAFYFESTFLFKLTLTDLPALNPTEIRKTFGKK